MVLSEVSQPLREQERQAWQRLVIGHELNNSLAAIKSIAGSLAALGLQNRANLFVPFFTTKPGGSGIGLVLSRQIAEAHGGSLTLQNRDAPGGTRATLRIPLEFLTRPADVAVDQMPSRVAEH